MDKVSLRAFGKINLSLNIVGKKENGYHLVDMVLHSVDIFDLVTIEKSMDSGILIKCNDFCTPTDEKNIIHKAAVLFFEETNINSGLKISLEKNIPLEAGMAGGSSDAAATLVGLNKLFDTGLSLEKLKTMGLCLGSDVPFCIEGGSARVEGVGEVLSKLPSISTKILVVKPRKGISTLEAYKAVNISKLQNAPDNDALILAMKDNNIEDLVKFMGNVFYDISSKMVPDIKFVVETLSQQKGCKKAMMSGSGSTVFGIFKEAEDMSMAAKAFIGRGYDIFCTSTMDNGISFI